MADLAKFVLRFAVVKITPETLQLEETTGGQTHNEISNGAKVGMDETAFSHSFLLHGIGDAWDVSNRQVSRTG